MLRSSSAISCGFALELDEIFERNSAHLNTGNYDRALLDISSIVKLFHLDRFELKFRHGLCIIAPVRRNPEPRRQKRADGEFILTPIARVDGLLAEGTEEDVQIGWSRE